MCIIFIYNGSYDIESDYSLIIVSNRDEYFNRPAQCMAPWKEDSCVYGGRDLQSGVEDGTWFGVNKTYKKIGVLLNLPGTNRDNASISNNSPELMVCTWESAVSCWSSHTIGIRESGTDRDSEADAGLSRGDIVTDYIRNASTAVEYTEPLKTNNKYNGFILVSVEFGNSSPLIQTYNNETNEIHTWTEECLGFSNSVPTNPLKKANYGKMLLKEVCEKYRKKYLKDQLIEELLNLLKNNESQLPDPQLENRQPKIYKELSSIYVKILEQYGTRAHTIFILSKTGHVDLIEASMISPIDPKNPTWKVSEYQFDI